MNSRIAVAARAAGLLTAVFFCGEASAHIHAGTTTGTPGICPAGQSPSYNTGGTTNYSSADSVMSAITNYFNGVFGATDHGYVNYSHDSAGNIGYAVYRQVSDEATTGGYNSNSGTAVFSCVASSCVAGDKIVGHSEIDAGTSLNTGMCSGGCIATLVGGYVVATFFVPGGPDRNLVNHTYQKTGAFCGTGPFTVSSSAQAAPAGCAASASGRQVCATSKNCGTVNGQSVCANPATNCGTVNGQTYCVGQATTPVCNKNAAGETICVSKPSNGLSVIGSPPAPDNGTAGQAVKPDVAISGTSGTGVTNTQAPQVRVDLYTAAQTAASTTQPPVAGEGACGGTGQPACAAAACGGTGQPACGAGGSCGGPDQPACKIDETGTPSTIDVTGGSSAALGAVWDGAINSAKNIETSGASSGVNSTGTSWWNLFSVTPGACQSVTFNFAMRGSGAQVVRFPGDSACAQFDNTKMMFGWLMLGYALLNIWEKLREL